MNSKRINLPFSLNVLRCSAFWTHIHTHIQHSFVNCAFLLSTSSIYKRSNRHSQFDLSFKRSILRCFTIITKSVEYTLMMGAATAFVWIWLPKSMETRLCLMSNFDCELQWKNINQAAAVINKNIHFWWLKSAFYAIYTWQNDAHWKNILDFISKHTYNYYTEEHT